MKRLLLAAVALSVFLTCPAYAATSSSEVEVINNVGIGDITIGLEEYELDEDGNEIPYENDKVVVPGQMVDKIVRITNEAEPAWIRAKLEYTSDEGIQGLSDSMVDLAIDGWVKIGDYYYYTEPVDSDAYIDFIDQVRIPETWTEDYAEKSFSIIVTAEAVQVKNFTPDFTSDDPWFGTIIETCVHTAYEAVSSADQLFEVDYEGGSEGLIKVGDDFFSNWGTLMPGDTVSDTVTVRNDYSRDIVVYFRTETIADDDLLSKLVLEIKNGDEVIYSGTLDGEITDKIRLGQLYKGQELELTYTLYVPAELNNAYALSATQTKWIFSVRYASSGRDNSGSSSGSSSSSSTSTNTTTTTESTESSDDNSDDDDSYKDPTKGGVNPYGPGGGSIVEDILKRGKKLVETGESRMMLYTFMVVLVSGIALVIVAVSKKRKKKEAGDKDGKE